MSAKETADGGAAFLSRRAAVSLSARPIFVAIAR